MAGLQNDSSYTIFRAGDSNVELARKAVAEVHGRAQVKHAQVSEFLRNSSHYLLLALYEERVVGSLMGYRLQHPHCAESQFLLYEIDVLRECRNRGIGKALIERFIREAQDAGAFEVWVLTNRSNEAAMKMYARCGLRQQHRDDVMLSLMLNKKGNPPDRELNKRG